jgi:hypothetical protein
MEGSTDFFLLNPIFWQSVWISNNKILSLKNQYLPHLNSENCEINFIKSDSLRAFQKGEEQPQNFTTIFSFNFV